MAIVFAVRRTALEAEDAISSDLQAGGPAALVAQKPQPRPKLTEFGRTSFHLGGDQDCKSVHGYR